MIISKIPIFITVRANTDEILCTNKEALKFSYLFIKDLELFSQTYIISDKQEMLDYAKELGFTNTILYTCGNEKDLLYLEYLATYRYGVEHNFYPDWIILVNVKQIFKNVALLRDCINNIDDKYDIIASYSEISDKSKFFIKDYNESNGTVTLNKNEILNKKESILSSKEERVKMIDAAIYAIKASFAFECMKYNDPSEHFWSGKIKYFKNNSLYTDIFTIEDINKYYEASDTINKIKNTEF